MSDPPDLRPLDDAEAASLRAIVGRLSGPLDPLPIGPLPPDLPPPGVDLTGIEAVIFDVYGTLIVSGSGDVGTAGAVDRAGAVADAWHAVTATPLDSADAEGLATGLTDAIARTHRRDRAAGTDFPEVRIVAIWRDAIVAAGIAPPAVPDLRRLAVEFECRVNPVWPMPGLTDCLDRLTAAGIVLGIVSNAQFFTPLVLEALTGRTVVGPPPTGLGFDGNLIAYSYLGGTAKPATAMYESVAANLAARGIEPAAALYVGNDRLNDVWPADTVGLSTALFAGDRRSLRLREDHPAAAGIVPTAVLTSLDDLRR